MTFSADGEALVGPVQLFHTGALLEFPAVSLANADDDGGDASRASVITDPPSDLQLGWDTSATSAESVDIVLAVVREGTEEPQEVAVLGHGPNSGSYRVSSAALDEFGLGNSLVFFKVCG